MTEERETKGPDEKFCATCGAIIKKEAEICPKCGVRQAVAPAVQVSDEEAGFLPKAAACCVPIVGLVLYLVWKDSKPRAAKGVCTWAIVGFVLGIVLYILGMVLGLGASLLGA
jgi:hypothetical protein